MVCALLTVTNRYADDAPPKEEPTPEVKEDVAAPVVVKVDAKDEAEQSGEIDQQMYGGEQDEDDEIDFNLGGNGNSYDAPASHHDAHGPGIKEDG